MKKQIMDTFLQKIQSHSFTIRYWDGEEINYGQGNPTMKFIFKQPLPLSFDLADPVLSAGEAYMDDIIDFEGNFDEVMKMAAKNKHLVARKNEKLLKDSVKLINRVSVKAKQKDNIHHHYDLGNDFFSLWLDDTMSYSCAYFKNPTDSLHQAQINKIDLILKKLQLKSGERLLDIGSGWGWLIIRAAQNYGVKATGITISEEQYKGTLERIEAYGLKDSVEVKLKDYMDLTASEAQYDKIVSVGMFEHVGKANLYKYVEKVNELLVTGGLSLLHSIMGTHEGGVNSWIDKYIFPGGYIPSLRETIALLPEYDFHLMHAESLKLHYAMTLDNWHDNYMKHWDEVEKKYGRRFARMWDLYLKACASNFRVSELNIYQLLFSKGLYNELSLALVDCLEL